MGSASSNLWLAPARSYLNTITNYQLPTTNNETMKLHPYSWTPPKLKSLSSILIHILFRYSTVTSPRWVVNSNKRRYLHREQIYSSSKSLGVLADFSVKPFEIMACPRPSLYETWGHYWSVQLRSVNKNPIQNGRPRTVPLFGLISVHKELYWGT